MHKSVAILILTAAVAAAQTTEFGHGEYLCYAANDVISRCWTDKNVPATAAPLKDCYCEWTADFDKDLIGCWEYIQTAVSFISPVETPGIPPYAGYCGLVTAPTSVPANPTSTSSTEASSTPDNTSTYVSASNPITYVTSIPTPSTVSASNPITYTTISYVNPHYNTTYTVSNPITLIPPTETTVIPEPTLIPPTETTVIPEPTLIPPTETIVSVPPKPTLIPPTATTVSTRPSYVPDQSSPIPPPPVATGGAGAKVGSMAVLAGGVVAAVAFAL
ncbi:hypothetical protein TWF679_006851 [Orbilia oligospora]|uniref:Extracellular membrane protein CFEM domain-containing protein n=1 Tax=Orbilia oligospora TaxID=2813651 RepID=A0A8H8V8U0_ORBOL|nr:hypothetical protein TWF679_006851 [Orbilia oligospora]